MIPPGLVAFIISIAILLFLTAASVTGMLLAQKRALRLRARFVRAIASTMPVSTASAAQLSLTRPPGSGEKFMARAAALVGADLAEADAYPVRWWVVPLITLTLSWLALFLASYPLGHAKLLEFAGVPPLCISSTKLLFTRFNNARNAKLLAQFPDALNTIVRCVRVGIPMADALRTVANDALEPTRTEFTILADKATIGIALDSALHDLAMRIRLAEYQFFAIALTLQARSGGGITQTLETLAEVIRKRVGLKARGYALTAEARTSAMILAILPFVAGAAIFVMQRAYISLLFDTKTGQSCLGAAVLLMGLGLGTIQFMISNVLK